jgi:hypothetical protein
VYGYTLHPASHGNQWRRGEAKPFSP